MKGIGSTQLLIKCFLFFFKLRTPSRDAEETRSGKSASLKIQEYDGILYIYIYTCNIHVYMCKSLCM